MQEEIEKIKKAFSKFSNEELINNITSMYGLILTYPINNPVFRGKENKLINNLKIAKEELLSRLNNQDINNFKKRLVEEIEKDIKTKEKESNKSSDMSFQYEKLFEIIEDKRIIKIINNFK